MAIHVDAKAFEDAMRAHARIFRLSGAAGNDSAVLHDVQHDEVTDELLHADFLRVDLSEKVDIQVPIHVVGPSAGEMEGGVLVEQLSQVTVRCLPMTIPEHIRVDSRPLGLHGTVHVSDLELPEGVEVVDEPERVVLTIAVPRGVAETGADDEEGEGDQPAEGGEAPDAKPAGD